LKVKEYTRYYKNRLKDAINTLSKESRINLSMTGIETDSIFLSLTAFSSNWTYFIFLENKRIVAFSRIKDVGKFFEIQGFFIPEDLQRKGYGSRLMFFLMGYSRGKGAEGIVLEVRKSNAKAIAFYSKLGFKKQKIKDLEVNHMELRF